MPTNLGSLAQLRFGGGGALQMKCRRMCGERLAVGDGHGGCHSPGTSQAQAAQAPGCTREGTVPGGLCISSGELGSGCDTAGRCEPSRIPGGRGQRLAACSVLGGSSLPGAETAVVLCLSLWLPCPVSASRRATNSSSPLIFARLRPSVL